MQTYLESGLEVLRHQPLRAPEILTKLVLGRTLYAMGPEQFFLYDLHNRPLRSWRDYRKWLSPFGAMMRAVNWAADANLSNDKVRTAARCADRDIPDIPILAVVGRDPSLPDGERFRALNGTDELGAFLRGAECPDRLYVKPARGSCGKGQYMLARHGDMWTTGGRTLAPVELAALLLEAAPMYGLAVQPCLHNHADMAPIGGALGLATARIVVALTVDGPVILAAVQKIIGGQGHIDNFLEGTSGNLIAAIDLPTGRLERVFGRRPGQRYLMSAVEAHPITGQHMIGFKLPLWQETKALVERVSIALPEQPLLGLDVAITDGGPLLVESNSTWDPALPQVATHQGIERLIGPVLDRLACNAEARARAKALLAA